LEESLELKIHLTSNEGGKGYGGVTLGNPEPNQGKDAVLTLTLTLTLTLGDTPPSSPRVQGGFVVDRPSLKDSNPGWRSSIASSIGSDSDELQEALEVTLTLTLTQALKI